MKLSKHLKRHMLPFLPLSSYKPGEIESDLREDSRVDGPSTACRLVAPKLHVGLPFWYAVPDNSWVWALAKKVQASF